MISFRSQGPVKAFHVAGVDSGAIAFIEPMAHLMSDYRKPGEAVDLDGRPVKNANHWKESSNITDTLRAALLKIF